MDEAHAPPASLDDATLDRLGPDELPDSFDDAEETPAAELRRDALVAYQAALHAPELRDDDPLVRARALVALADAKDAYAAAGGRPSSRHAEQFVHIYDEAREIVAAADATAPEEVQ